MTYAKLLMALFMALFPATRLLAGEIIEVQFDALPDSVKNAALAIIDKRNISKISQIDSNNLIKYRIEVDKAENNKEVTSWDIEIASNGKIMKLAKEVPYYTLSYPQMQEIEKRYPGIKVIEAEAVDIHFYDVIGDVNGKTVNFRFYENGLIEDHSNP